MPSFYSEFYSAATVFMGSCHYIGYFPQDFYLLSGGCREFFGTWMQTVGMGVAADGKHNAATLPEPIRGRSHQQPVTQIHFVHFSRRYSYREDAKRNGPDGKFPRASSRRYLGKFPGRQAAAVALSAAAAPVTIERREWA